MYTPCEYHELAYVLPAELLIRDHVSVLAPTLIDVIMRIIQTCTESNVGKEC